MNHVVTCLLNNAKIVIKLIVTNPDNNDNFNHQKYSKAGKFVSEPDIPSPVHYQVF